MENCVYKKYLKIAEKYPLLSEEEEQALARRIEKDNDAKAFDTLVLSNLRLVITLANRYKMRLHKNPYLVMDDLVQVGNIGLMCASERFKAGAGAKFSSYSRWWINNKISTFIEQSGVIHPTKGTGKRATRIKKFKENFIKEHGREPERHELPFSKRENLTEETINAATNILIESMDASSSEFMGKDDRSEYEFFADKSAINPLDFTLRNELKKDLAESMTTILNDKERTVISLLYGLDGQGQRPLQKAGAAIGRTAEMARVIQNKALRKMRKYIEEK